MNPTAAPLTYIVETILQELKDVLSQLTPQEYAEKKKQFIGFNYWNACSA